MHGCDGTPKVHCFQAKRPGAALDARARAPAAKRVGSMKKACVHIFVSTCEIFRVLQVPKMPYLPSSRVSTVQQASPAREPEPGVPEGECPQTQVRESRAAESLEATQLPSRPGLSGRHPRCTSPGGRSSKAGSGRSGRVRHQWAAPVESILRSWCSWLAGFPTLADRLTSDLEGTDAQIREPCCH